MTVARTTSVGQKLFGKASQLVTLSQASRKLEADVAAARSNPVTTDALVALKELHVCVSLIPASASTPKKKKKPKKKNPKKK